MVEQSRAIAIGDFAQAHGFCAVAVGRGARALGDFSVALGSEAVADGDYQVAIRCDDLDRFRDDMRKIRKVVPTVLHDPAHQTAIFAVIRLAEILVEQNFQKVVDGNMPSVYTLIIPIQEESDDGQTREKPSRG